MLKGLKGCSISLEYLYIYINLWINSCRIIMAATKQSPERYTFSGS